MLADQPTDPRPARLIENRILVTSDEPVRHNPRRMAPGVLEAARKIENIIERSDSDYSSAPVMVRKPYDTYHTCIGYRDVNVRLARTLC